MTSEIYIYEWLAHTAIEIGWYLAWPLIRLAFWIWDKATDLLYQRNVYWMVDLTPTDGTELLTLLIMMSACIAFGHWGILQLFS